jgi:cellulose synthase/poly-beta-1,6-N-acetylglucosamine synthase-like glycosyltransferase
MVPRLLIAWRVLTSAARASFKSLLAVWFGYPLIMAGLAARKRVPAPEASDIEPASDADGRGDGEPTISVIIATRDDEAVVRSRIADCLRSSYAPEKLEVVVALDRHCAEAAATRLLSRVAASASPDGRCTIVLGDEPGGKAATLNAAVRASRGDVLVFTDTHQRFEPDAIAHLVAALQQPGVGATSGSLELPRANGSSPPLINRYWALERWLRRCEARVHSSVGVSGAIWALRRSLWSPLPADLILDDLYTPMRTALSGYRVAFAESARAIETRRTLVGHEYRRKVRTLTGVIQLCAWQPAVLVPLRNPIWLQFVTHKLLRLLTPYWVMAIGAWLGSRSVCWLAANPGLTVGLTPAVVAAGYARRGMVRRLWGGVVCALTIQAAVVVATFNGVRRRWDVWRV